MIYAPHNIHNDPASLKQFLSQVLSVVLNTTTKNLVLLPLANEAVANCENLVLNEHLDIMTIDGESYNALADLLKLSTPNQPEVAINLFTERCKLAVSDDMTPLSDTAYRLIYETLSYNPINDSDSTIEDLLKIIPEIVENYYEDTVDTLLNKANIDHDDMPRNNKVVAAESYLKNTLGKVFLFSYFLDEEKPTKQVAILYATK